MSVLIKESRDIKDDNVVNKVSSLEIIVRMIDSKPYYEIKYKKIGEDYYHVGYSSYNINNVLKWRDECFDIVSERKTNADRIRSMSDEELAEWLSKHDLWLGDDVLPMTNDWLEWLQSPVDEVSDIENLKVRR